MKFINNLFFRIILNSLLLQLLFFFLAFSETIVFKSGRTADVKVMDKNEYFIRVTDSEGNIKFYSTYDIEKIIEGKTEDTSRRNKVEPFTQGKQISVESSAQQEEVNILKDVLEEMKKDSLPVKDKKKNSNNTKKGGS
ncbi:MAG: hypothetical protein KBB01_04515 [Candidatus Omnitrophica bacterium]|jgi:preprotein translocase subunit SecF|nr:hypothetical protein [Candidatus Omnitrophota bacterium]